MKKALLSSFTRIFFSSQSFPHLLSLTTRFIRETSTSVVIAVEAAKFQGGLTCLPLLNRNNTKYQNSERKLIKEIIKP
jgi:hypothetical protein